MCLLGIIFSVLCTRAVVKPKSQSAMQLQQHSQESGLSALSLGMQST